LATEDDQVTQDLLIEISAVLEKHYWMWQAQSIA
jgi:starvation-inducible DNA-binding protein